VRDPFEEPRHGQVAGAQLTLDPPFRHPAVADPDHDSVKHVQFGYLQDVLEDAELLAVTGEHRNPGRHSLVGDRELVVVHETS
jgi:hypothetical protein